MASRTLRRLLTEEPASKPESSESDNVHEDQPRATIFSQINLLSEETYSPTALDKDQNDDFEQHSTQVIYKTKTKSKKKKKRREKSPDLAELGIQSYVDTLDTFTIPCTTNNVGAVCVTDLLSVDMKTLDPELELSRMFGSNILRDGVANRLGDSRSAHSVRSSLKRGSLVRIKPNWPPLIRFGFDMIQISDGGSYSFTHTNEYRKMQKSFFEALDSMDPNNLMELLNKCPYHVDASLQLSDLFIQQDNSEIGIDLLERVLHAYQSAFDPRFNPALVTGRLDFVHQENRGLFVAVFRYANVLASRGCYRNALDYTKILLGLNVEEDPLAALLMIDHYALLSRQLDFLVRLYDRLNPSRNLYLLPNFAYSVALAVKWLGKSKADRNADELLQDALIMFPGFLPRILKHTTIGGGVTNLDKSVLFGSEVRKEPDSLGRLLDLYVARTHQLWSAPDVHIWLERNIEVVLTLVERSHCDGVDYGQSIAVDPRLSEYSTRRKTLYPALPLNVVRHLILADITEAPPMLPRDRLSSAIYRFDPLPPANSIDIYCPDEDRRNRRLGRHDEGIMSLFFNSLLPGYDARRQTADTDGSSILAGVQENLAAATEWFTSAFRNSNILNPPDQTESADEHAP